MKKMLFAAAAALLFASCAKTTNETVENVDLNGEWAVVAINGEEVPADVLNAPVLAFDTEEMVFCGATGVNLIAETAFELNGSELVLAEAATTKMAGDSVSMAVEDQFLVALAAVVGAEEAEGQLLLKDAEGNVTELECTYDPSTKPGGGEWRSVKGTIHWVSCDYAKELELRNYDRLFTLADMSQVPEDKDYKDFLNPESLTLGSGLAEPALLEDASGIAVQFERTGYYIKDSDSTPEHPVFNKTTALKDSYKPA